MTLLEFLAKRSAGEISAREFLETCAARIESRNPEINALVSLDLDRAAQQAGAYDSAHPPGSPGLPLGGVPVAVKDLYDVAGLPTLSGSWLAAGEPATRDAAAVAALRRLGAVFPGKAATSELGWRAETVTFRFGATRNPYNLSRGVGGSSGGSAAAVAAGMLPLALGSDGGGSMRIPAAYLGLAGYRASRGILPSLVPGSEAVAGLFAADLPSLARALDAFRSSPPAGDPDFIRQRPFFFSHFAAAPKLPNRVAVIRLRDGRPAHPEIDGALTVLAAELSDAGAEVIEAGGEFDGPWIELLESRYGAPIVAAIEAGREVEVDPALADLAERVSRLGPAGSARLAAAGRVLISRLVELAQRVDLILAPATLDLAPTDPEPASYVPDPAGFTYQVSLANLAALSLPAGVDGGGVPFGLQLAVAPYQDPVLMRYAAYVAGLLPAVRPAADQSPARGSSGWE